MSHFSAEAHLLKFQPQQKQRQLITAIVLVLGFALSEALMGAWSHSWALVAEAGHLVADSAGRVVSVAQSANPNAALSATKCPASATSAQL